MRSSSRHVLTVTSVLICATAAKATTYTVLDLGTLGGPTSSLSSGSHALNASGQVVGTSGTAASSGHAFRTAANQPITPDDDLGNMGGIKLTIASGINDAGQTIGWGYLADNTSYHAFRLSATGTLPNPAADLGTLGGTKSAASGINASSQVVGNAYLAGDAVRHAFRTAPNGYVTDAGADLGTLGGTNSQASAINASGQTVGDADLADGSVHAFRISATQKVSDPGTDLGTLGGQASQAWDINVAGQVVGDAYLAAGVYHAFRTTATGKVSDPGTDLGTLGGTDSWAHAINDLGQVVGYSFMPGNGGTHAFFVDVTGGMLDLNELIPPGSGWVLQSAASINDAGQIAGFGSINGTQHVFLLTPTPEPGGTIATVIALVGLTVRRRRNSTSPDAARLRAG